MCEKDPQTRFNTPKASKISVHYPFPDPEDQSLASLESLDRPCTITTPYVCKKSKRLHSRLFRAIRGERTPLLPFSASAHKAKTRAYYSATPQQKNTERISANKDKGLHEGAREGNGVPGGTRTPNPLVRRQALSSCNTLETNDLQRAKNPVAPTVAPEFKIDRKQALLETLRGMGRDELLALLADVLSGGGS